MAATPATTTADAAVEDAVRKLVRAALEEDSGGVGDLTTEATVPAESTVEASFLAKADGVVAGLRVAEIVFEEVGPPCVCRWDVADGDRVRSGQVFGTVRGPARAVLVGERVALNFMQRMSGIATLTRRMVDRVGAHRARVLDTRKTAPLLRVADKWAVRLGGGANHRFGLWDMCMIKDNHVAAAGGVREAIRAVRASLGARGLAGRVEVEVETRTLDEVRDALAEADAGGGVDRIMLDNMVRRTGAAGELDTSMLEEAVRLVGGRVPTEASGNVTLDTIGAIAATGVDYISSGALTHSVRALDISLKIDLATASGVAL